MKSGRDHKIAFIIGLVSSVVWFFALKHVVMVSEGKLAIVVLLLPVLFVIGISLANTIFKKGMLHKGMKFFIVGILNTGIDFFIFNTFIGLTGIDSGAWVLLFKSLSFLGALLNSYELNRLWTFDDRAATKRNKKEFSRFVVITVASFIINVGATALIANGMHPLFGLSQVRWDNVAAAIATIFNLILNFVGYKLFVFISDNV